MASDSRAIPRPTARPFSNKSKLSKTGRQLNWYMVPAGPDLRVAHAEFDRKAHRRRRQLHAEKFLETGRVGIELHARHALVQDRVDEVHPHRVPLPNRRRISLRR